MRKLSIEDIRLVWSIHTLERLDAREGTLTEIPPSVGKLSSLNTLLLDKSPIRNIPDELFECRSLVSLSFQDCGIETIEYLELGGNRFAQLPDLRRLTKLQGLVLRRMKLRCVPAQICDLEERLNNIGNRRKHNVLELDGNRITSLPDTIGELVNLRRLSPRKNRLSSIPKTITKIKGIVDLRELCLSGNPFPKEALNYSSYKSIRERLKALRVLFEGASSSPKESTGKPRERTTVSTAKPKARDSSDPAMPREEVSTRYSTCCAGKWIFPPAQTESLIRISR